MDKVTGDGIRYELEKINNIRRKQYALEHPKEERNLKNYELGFGHRIKKTMMDLDPLGNEAVSAIRAGHPHSLSLKQGVNLLLIKHLVGKSNKMFSSMLVIFCMISGIDI